MGQCFFKTKQKQFRIEDFVFQKDEEIDYLGFKPKNLIYVRKRLCFNFKKY